MNSFCWEVCQSIVLNLCPSLPTWDYKYEKDARAYCMQKNAEIRKNFCLSLLYNILYLCLLLVVWDTLDIFYSNTYEVSQNVWYYKMPAIQVTHVQQVRKIRFNGTVISKEASLEAGNVLLLVGTHSSSDSVLHHMTLETMVWLLPFLPRLKVSTVSSSKLDT